MERRELPQRSWLRLAALGTVNEALFFTYIVVVSFWMPLVFDEFLEGAERTSALAVAIFCGGVLQLAGPAIAERATFLFAMSRWVVFGMVTSIPAFVAIAVAATPTFWDAPPPLHRNATGDANGASWSFLRSGRFWLVFCGYFGYQLFSTVGAQPFSGLVPAHVAASQRGFMSGAIGVHQLVGSALGSAVGVLLGSGALPLVGLVALLVAMNVACALTTAFALRGVEHSPSPATARKSLRTGCTAALFATALGPCCHGATSRAPRSRGTRAETGDGAAGGQPSRAGRGASPRALGRRFTGLFVVCAATASAQQITTFFLIYFLQDTRAFPIVVRGRALVATPTTAAAAWYLLQLLTAALCAPLGGFVADFQAPQRGAAARRPWHACCGRRGAMVSAMLCALATPAVFIGALAADATWVWCCLIVAAALTSGAAQVRV